MARRAASNRQSRSLAPVKGNKRKRGSNGTIQIESHGNINANQPTKRVKLSPNGEPVSKRPTAIPKSAARKIKEKINKPPSNPLDIFVFGEGICGELGLGSKTINGESITNVLRPRLNKFLSSQDVGVVQVACGGMHAVALTRDNRILSWGGNDDGALGRSTSVEEEDDDDELNPAESTPGLVDTSDLDPDIRWTQVVASDSASFALGEDGRVYGWGTFRSNEGIMGFDGHTRIQKKPILIPDLKNITQLAAGVNHIVALDQQGTIFTWGAGDSNQLGRRVIPGHPELALRPTSIGSLATRRGGAKAAQIACGSYHSFAVDTQGRVYGWGQNTYAELAIADHAGESNAFLLKPRLVESLGGYRIVGIEGGEHHSLACTDEGKLLTWGRIDGDQVGLRQDALTAEKTIFDDRGKPRILKTPTIVPDVPSVVSVAAGTDHSIALTVDGQAYSWGFSDSGRTGQGTVDDIKVPTLIDSKAIKGKKCVYADAGGSFSVLACVAGV